MIDGIHEVTIQATPAGIGSKVWLDGVELQGVIKVSFEVAVGEVTTCTITFRASLGNRIQQRG